NDALPVPYKIELRPKSDFNYETAVQKIASLTSLETGPDVRFLVPAEGDSQAPTLQATLDEAGFSAGRGHALFTSSCLDLENRVSVGCAGAVITYLQRRRTSGYLQGDPAGDAAYPILKLDIFSLKDTMLINADTLAALQIVQPESHPNAAKQGPGAYGAKESLSVYGLFYRFARTPQGKQKLRHMLLHPSLDPDLIRERHNSVGVFIRAENLSALSGLSKSMSKIKNLRRVMIQLRKGIEGGNASAGKIKS
ncbi:hypothetical protein LTR66_017096, partial [Elasticomyces elasticus]